MNKKLILSLFVLCLFSLKSIAEIVLEKGTIHRDVSAFPQEYKMKIWDLEDVAASKEAESLSSIIAYVPVTTGPKKFVLGRELTIAEINLESNLLLGNWPLTPWPSHLFLEGENTAAVKKIAAVHNEPYSEKNDLLAIQDDNTPYYSLANLSDLTFQTGCYQQSPLRYGDLENDGENELVLMLRKNIIVFSPKEEKITFSAHYWLSDELAPEDVSDHFPGEISENKAQMVAGSGTDNLIREILPAKRSMSKIYVGDFNNNGKSDIILWRKMYQSNLRNNSILGFHKLAEGGFHYEKNENGEYQLQTDTAPETIQGWLDAKNLTWQSGFPTKSECAGQEGQLIPEMHDPLLNDPDVLK